MKRLALMLTVALWASSALAGPFDGVFVSDPQGCGWLKKEGAQALFEHDFLTLTLKDGINANEFGCEFLDSKPAAGGDALVITAFCEYPGEPFPDLISLRTFDESSITLTSVWKLAEDAAYGVDGNWGSQIYTRCNDLEELPQ
ncbi:MAG: hypothetical protein H6873_09950 [Hyphomicrobiaceae bacterium]|nr:hypothetical protein [Hyphomicrobiaceae bacterium]